MVNVHSKQRRRLKGEALQTEPCAARQELVFVLAIVTITSHLPLAIHGVDFFV